MNPSLFVLGFLCLLFSLIFSVLAATLITVISWLFRSLQERRYQRRWDKAIARCADAFSAAGLRMGDENLYSPYKAFEFMAHELYGLETPEIRAAIEEYKRACREPWYTAAEIAAVLLGFLFALGATALLWWLTNF